MFVSIISISKEYNIIHYKTAWTCNRMRATPPSTAIDVTTTKALAKRSQHANATCRNIVWRNMLRALATVLRNVATRWVLFAQI